MCKIEKNQKNIIFFVFSSRYYMRVCVKNTKNIQINIKSQKMEDYLKK